ncbi:hydroxymethylglutaryl-CoA reductase, degradative [Candidatus Dependentiae bacterium]|nr:hydroxymethylglutaryl-CoA reductase, degradative [Candidatus Dependentiae bacterium]
MKNSEIIKFYKKNQTQRLDIVRSFANLNDLEIQKLKQFNSLNFTCANRMIENVISIMPLPLGIATNFKINNIDYLIPMAIEEPSVIAAASSAAKIARKSGGFIASSTESLMIGQIQLTNVKDLSFAINQIEKNKKEILNQVNQCDSILISLNGGAKAIKYRIINTKKQTMLIIHLIVDVKDAMGANIVNTMVEKISPFLEKLTNSVSILKIISNLPVYRIAKSKAVWKKELISEKIIQRILDSYQLALHDPFRCATHNKGIMNGIDALAIATGNDFRAIEAGAHAFACLTNKYQPLTKYYLDENQNLVGEIEMPITAATIGGITQTHETAKICLKILNVKTSKELAQIMASLGLAQNFAALRALVTDGIQKNHMKLHSKNIAIAAGASEENVDAISNMMCKQNNISISNAKELIENYANK